MTKLYARALVPNYVKLSEWSDRESLDYSPWVIANEDPDTLTNESLDERYTEFTSQADVEEDPDFSEFIDWLEDQELGYVVHNVEETGVWSPRRD